MSQKVAVLWTVVYPEDKSEIHIVSQSFTPIHFKTNFPLYPHKNYNMPYDSKSNLTAIYV